MTDLIFQIAPGGNARVGERVVAGPSPEAANESQPETTLVPPVNETEPAPAEENMADVVERINEVVRARHRNLEFSIDEASGHRVIKVIDADTEEIIRQFPSDEFLAMSRHIEDFAGLLFDAKT